MKTHRGSRMHGQKVKGCMRESRGEGREEIGRGREEGERERDRDRDRVFDSLFRG